MAVIGGRRKNFAAAAAVAAVVWNYSTVDGMGGYMYRIEPTGIPNPKVEETQLLEHHGLGKGQVLFSHFLKY